MKQATRGRLALGLVLAVMTLVGCAGSPGTPGSPGAPAPTAPGHVEGWLNWRGSDHNGISDDAMLPGELALQGPHHLWTHELSGRGTPVIAGERVYAMGYQGEGPDLQEVLVCLDARTGARLWDVRFNDFLSDIIYTRYSIGAPAVDPDTGQIYVITAAGLLTCVSPSGRVVWQVSMMEEFGRLTFPNGRTGAPLVEGDLVVTHFITSNWGSDGPARDRFYAFDKRTGQLVWSSTPGIGPKDSSFSTPVPGWWNGQRVLYAGTGCGNIVALNARNGEPLWRFRASQGGVNITPAIAGDLLVTVHEDENLDTSEKGRLIALRIPKTLTGDARPMVLGGEAEVWRQPVAALSTSPVIVGDSVYQVSKSGVLHALDLQTGRERWARKLGADQLHASPLVVNGRMYLPMWHDGFYVLKLTDQGPEVLSHITFAEGEECLGAPAAWDGRLYLLTTRRLYCFGTRAERIAGGQRRPVPASRVVEPGPAVRLQVVPAEVLLKPGQTQTFTMRPIDAHGFAAASPSAAGVPTWSKYIPPTARVRSEMDARVDASGTMVAGDKLSAGAWEVQWGGVKGLVRGRVMPSLPMSEDFESFVTSVPHDTDKDAAGAPVKFAYPPLPWIGARFKFEVRELDGNKVLAKTLDVPLFQRGTAFIGPSDLSGYTVQADVMTDGNRRLMSIVGVINQRYQIALVGNAQQLEVSSNQDRIKVGVPFKIEPGVWYRLKTRVDVAADGSGVVRAKAWKVAESEPADWTIQVPHKAAHRHGSPGLFGFALQSKFRVYLDNIRVTLN